MEAEAHFPFFTELKSGHFHEILFLIRRLSGIRTIEITNLISNHHLYEILLFYIFYLYSVYFSAVPQNRNFIGNFENLAQMVRNINDCDSLVPQVTDHLKHVFHLIFGQCSRRLIHNQYLRLRMQRFGYFHHLLALYIQILHQIFRPDFVTDTAKRHICLIIYLLPRYSPSMCFPCLILVNGIHKNIFCNAQIRKKVKLLMYDRYSIFLRLIRTLKVHFTALIYHRARTFPIDS